eukprot:scaffold102138_cov45-Tisochrysis_lutea.AAC.2
MVPCLWSPRPFVTDRSAHSPECQHRPMPAPAAGKAGLRVGTASSSRREVGMFGQELRTLLPLPAAARSARAPARL